MKKYQECNPLVVIIGPTAVGKTEISLRVAERLNGEIVSADSRLFYRGMDIGTAKPSREDQSLVPHHFVDVAEPDEDWSLAVYLPKSIEVIRNIHKRGNLPFLVGGTGQYIQAVVRGWDLPGIKPDLRLREILRQWAEQIGVDGIRDRLAELDPEAASGIDGPNLRRMIRAMEVILSSGKKFSEQKKAHGSQFQVFQIGLSRTREDLYRRIDLRVDQMVERGLVDEVQALLDKGYMAELSALSAIGYKQIIKFLAGEISKDEAVRLIKSKSHKYVRQQANWFQHDDPDIHWFSAEPDPSEKIINEIQHFLSHICYTRNSHL
ncbi:MAG: tRNA (adenosine(37)-N6)-dimethylallyltransferase MiaA [Anaerolineales bacterium]|nr:tRNA (adenosine(37)-N6)-dimethylallyltransferase MiaA [Anaerolineales bacterium]